MTSLSDRLKALGVRSRTQGRSRSDGPSDDRDPSPPRQRRTHPIERVVAGHLKETPDGQAFVVQTTYPLDWRHGCASLRLTAPLCTIAEWANEPSLNDGAAQRLAFLDVESTGLARGPGTYAFLIGLGYSDREHFCLTQFFLRDPGEEPALLSAVLETLQASQALVTFNGKGFDLPLLNARYITNGRTMLPAIAHLDLLPLARRLWRDRLPSRALGSLEHHVLGVRRSQEDVPGWMIPQLYFGYLRGGDARPLKSVFYHNAMDVLSMAALLNHMAGMLDDPFGWQPIDTLDLLGMARLFESVGRIDLCVRLYERALTRDLPTELYRGAAQRLSFIQKRQDRWQPAIDLWREAAEAGEIYAHVELAKYYEHRMHDFCEAARWTMSAMQRVAAPGYPHLSRQRWLADLQHRLARLHRRADSWGQEWPPTEPSAQQGPISGIRGGTDQGAS